MDNQAHEVANYASGHSRAQWVSILLGIIIVLDIVALVSGYIEIQLLNRVLRGETITMVEATANDTRQAAIGITYLVLFVITAILFCMWIHRAYRNLPSLGVSGLKYSPGWAVGGFFVPILNLFRPFQITREIWKASDPATDINDSLAWQSATTSPIIAFWWVLWIVSGLLGQVLLRMSFQAETLSEILTSSWLTFVADAFEIPTAILAILVVRGIDFRQRDKHRRISGYGTTV